MLGLAGEEGLVVFRHTGGRRNDDSAVNDQRNFQLVFNGEDPEHIREGLSTEVLKTT